MKPFTRIQAAAFALAFLLGLFPAHTAFAQDTPTEYLFQLQEDAPAVAALSSRSSAFEPVAYADGYYTTRDLAQLQLLLDAGLVAYAVPNGQVTLFDAPMTNDPGLANQWYLDNIKAYAPRAAGLNGFGVTVAVIDSGLVQSHEDFAYDKITGQNFLTDQTSENYTDVTGHGTLATGIIAAQSDNGVGIAGLADQADILSLRCFREKDTTVADILSAVSYAIQNGADVINMSFGGTNSAVLQPLDNVLKRADAADILLVAAVGNAGTAVPNYPAAYAQVTGVGMIQSDNTVDPLSQRNSSVFVTAPGRTIYGIGFTPSAPYRTDSGTSFAAPIVSAMAAMTKQADSAIDNDGFRTLLNACATDRGAVGYDVNYGWGTVDLERFSTLLTGPTPITYELNGGTLPKNSLAGFTIHRSTPALLPTPSKEQHNFLGWYTTADFSGQAVDCVPPGTVSPVTYYAKWDATAAPISPELTAITVSGIPAQKTGLAYSVVLPYGTDLTALTAGDVVIEPADSRATIDFTFSNALTDNMLQQSISITNSQPPTTYTLQISVANAGAPSRAAEQPATISGSATPGSYDGRTLAVPYTVSMLSWFDNATEFQLSHDGTGTLTQSGGTLTYTPSAADAEKPVQLTVQGKNQWGISADTVTVSLTIGALPISHAQLVPTSLSYDKKVNADQSITIKLYGNHLTQISGNSFPLSAGTHYTHTPPTIAGNDGTVTLRTAYLNSLSAGSHSLLFTFDHGNAATLSLTVSDSTVTEQPSGGGGGGGGGGLPAPKVPEVQLFSGGTIPVSYVLTDGIATLSVTAADLEKLHTSGKAMRLDFSADKSITAITLSGSDLVALAKNGLELHTYSGGFALDADTAKGLQSAKAVTFRSKQLADIDGRPAFDITLTADGTAVTLPQSPVTLLLPYTLQPGEQADGLGVSRKDADGTRIALSAQWNENTKQIAAKTDHLSHFIITHAAPWQNPFTDLAPSNWFYDSVAYTCRNNLFQGTTATRFDPYGETSRAMFVTLLWRMAGSPAPAKEHGFSDVAPGLWYTQAVAWAAQTGIARGTSATSFDPGRAITRQELAAMLHSYASHTGQVLPQTLALTTFQDGAQIADWAKTPVAQLQQAGVLQGTETGHYAPERTATRSETAAVLHRFGLLGLK